MDEPLRESHLYIVSDCITDDDGLLEFAKAFCKLTDSECMDVASSKNSTLVYKWNALIIWRNQGENARRTVLDLSLIVRRLKCGAEACDCKGVSSRDDVLNILTENNQMQDYLTSDVLLAVAKCLTMKHLEEMLHQRELSKATIENNLEHIPKQSLQEKCLKVLKLWWNRNQDAIVLSLYVVLRQAEDYSDHELRIIKPKTARRLYKEAVGIPNEARGRLRPEQEAELEKWNTFLRLISNEGMCCQPHGGEIRSLDGTVCVEATTTLDTLVKRLEEYEKEPLNFPDTQLYAAQLQAVQTMEQTTSSARISQGSSSGDSQVASTYSQDSDYDRATGMILLTNIMNALLINPQDVHIGSQCDRLWGKPLMKINLRNQTCSLILSEKAAIAKFEHRNKIRMKEGKNITRKVARCLNRKYNSMELLSGCGPQKRCRDEKSYIPRALRQVSTFPSARNKQTSGKEIHESNLLHAIHNVTLKRVLVYAASGSGKSTLCKKIAIKLTNKDEKYLKQLPYNYALLIDGNKIREGDTIRGYIKRELLSASDVSDEELKRFLHDNQSFILFLLDGIDQANRDTQEPTTSSQTESFKNLLAGSYLSESTVIMTGYPKSRYVLGNQTQIETYTYELLPLSYQNIKQFLNELPDEVKVRCMELSLANHELAALMEMPLFLWLVVCFCESESNITNNKYITKTFLMKHLITSTEHNTQHLKYNYLQKKAYECCKQNTDRFISSKRATLAPFIAAEAGILCPYQFPQQAKKDVSYYRFESSEIMSFLAAQYIASCHSRCTCKFTCNIETMLDELNINMTSDNQNFMSVVYFVVGLLSMKAVQKSPGTCLLQRTSKSLKKCRQLCARLINKFCSSLRADDTFHETHDIFRCIAEADSIIDPQFCNKISEKLCNQLWYDQVLCTSCCGRAMVTLVKYGGCTVHLNGQQTSNSEDLQAELSKLYQFNRREGLVNMDNLSRALGTTGVYSNQPTDCIIVQDCPKMLAEVGTVTSEELTIDNSNPLLARQLIQNIRSPTKIEIRNLTKSRDLRESVIHALVQHKPRIREVKLKDKCFYVQRSLVQSITELCQLRALSLDTEDSENTADEAVELLDDILTRCAGLDRVEYMSKHGSALRRVVNFVEKLKRVLWRRLRLVGETILDLVDLIVQCTGFGRCTSLFTAQKSNGPKKPSAVIVIGDGAQCGEVWEELLASGTDVHTVELHCQDLKTFVSILVYGKENKKEEFEKMQFDHLRVNLRSKLREGDYKMKHLIESSLRKEGHKEYALEELLPDRSTDLYVCGSEGSHVDIHATSWITGTWSVLEKPLRSSKEVS